MSLARFPILISRRRSGPVWRTMASGCLCLLLATACATPTGPGCDPGPTRPARGDLGVNLVAPSGACR